MSDTSSTRLFVKRLRSARNQGSRWRKLPEPARSSVRTKATHSYADIQFMKASKIRSRSRALTEEAGAPKMGVTKVEPSLTNESRLSEYSCQRPDANLAQDNTARFSTTNSKGKPRVVLRRMSVSYHMSPVHTEETLQSMFVLIDHILSKSEGSGETYERSSSKLPPAEQTRQYPPNTL